MSDQIIPQNPVSRNQQIALIPIGQLPTGQLPGLVQIAGHFIHCPVIEDDKIVVDTGRQILEFDTDEVAVMRLVIQALEVA